MADLIIALAALALLAIVATILMAQKIRKKICSWFAPKKDRLWLLVLLLTAYYGFAIWLIGEFSWIAILNLFLYLSLPALLICCSVFESESGTFLDFLLLICLWLPIELRLMPATYLTDYASRIFPHFLLLTLSLAIYSLIIFPAYRRIDLNCSFWICWRDIKVILAVLFGIACMVMALMASGVFHLEPTKIARKSVWCLPLLLMFIFYIQALPQEVLFRGFLQNALVEKAGSMIGILTSSLIFGFAHFTDKVGNSKIPNLAYIFFIIASGIGYGIVYRKSGSLLTAAITHAVVGLAWLTLLQGGMV